jgi:TatD DNase family protein
MIDTHAHIYDEKFADDRHKMLLRAFDGGIDRIYMPNIDAGSVLPMLELADQYPSKCIPMMGLHPCYVKSDYRQVLTDLKPWFGKRSFAAVGEIGTDLYWDKTTFEWQKDAFIIQCNWAIELDLPVVIHCRESINETIELVNEFAPSSLTGIFHCFSGDLEQAKAIIDLNFMLGIGGVATFKNGGIGEVIEQIALEHMVLETDSPYLAPAPYRGKRNEPAYINMVAGKIAEIKGVTVEAVATATTKNAKSIFKL